MTPEKAIEFAKQAMLDACANVGEELPSQEVLDSEHADADVIWYFQRFAALVRNATLEEAAVKCDEEAEKWIAYIEGAEGCEGCANEIRSMKA